MSRLGAESGHTMEAKLHGLYPNVHDFYRHSQISGRKRAFRRARGRAQRNCLGGTWYRGRWLRADAAVAGLPQRQAAPRVQSQVRRAASSAGTDEVRFISYNVGGSSTDNYDVFGNWLQQLQLADVVIFQEVHWGLGKEDSSFQICSRSVMTSIDSNNRFSGIAICVSKKLIDAADLRFSSVVPGRLMHVRCLRSGFCLDIVGTYQWAWNMQHVSLTEQRRRQVWTSAGRLLSQFPRRNLLLLGCDANTPAVPD